MSTQPKWTSDCVQFTATPEGYVTSPGGEGFKEWCDEHRDDVKWSGKEAPPPLGTEIVVEFNKLGPAKVVGYFIEYGWLGLEVQLHAPPDWWVRNAQRHGFKTAFIFGLDYRRA